MDIEQFISLPSQRLFACEESQHLELPFDLYDENSEREQDNVCLSVDQVYSQLLQNPNIIDLPMTQIIEMATDEFNLCNSLKTQLIRKMKKAKNILKRNRARTRQANIPEQPTIIDKRFTPFDQSSTEKDTMTIQKQFKKQRNRISAQISRDRKKNYFYNLELQNKELLNEKQQLRLQNQRLKKQIVQKPKVIHNVKGGKFMHLLVLLGIMFIFYIFKDLLSSKSAKSKNVTNIQPNVQDDNILEMFGMGENDEIIEEIKNTLHFTQEECNLIQTKVNGQSSSFKLMRQKLIKSVDDFGSKIKSILAPNLVKGHLFSIKNMLCL